MRSQRRSVRLPLLMLRASLALAFMAMPAAAQFAPDAEQTFGGQSFGGHRGHRGGGRQPRNAPKATPAASPAPVRLPWPRLDQGALLCRTEADLQQHQTAVETRLDGGAATDTSDCRLVQAMTAVTVVARHGPARTEIRLPGPSDQSLGWTDAVLPDAPPR